ncbi:MULTISPECIES: CIA30 family protein [Flavobacteriaceae]|uniref:CIA30 family protein n=2 Tax=Flavobacteriaceae TaxID=49546 RepID=A0A4Y8AUD1_9FLAO|nr:MULTISPECIES: CIA30 family protein [Flavobacteriaceae]TEW75475.1 CIA30 family protein [Gramella jeungdoensis]
MSILLNANHTIVDFTKNSKLHSWSIVNDVVMGGKSTSTIEINEEGNAVFKGAVSLENNGGFSSLRYRFEKLDISNFSKIKIRLKGDGKKYQFRIKPSRFNQYSYVGYFQTSGEWQTIELKLTDLTPVFRGRKLDMPNFYGTELEEVGFLIGNKKQEKFQLILDAIILE